MRLELLFSDWARAMSLKYLKGHDYLTYDDLYQQGMMALTEALQTFNLQKHKDFKGYVLTCIRNSILNLIYRNRSVVSLGKLAITQNVKTTNIGPIQDSKYYATVDDAYSLYAKKELTHKIAKLKFSAKQQIIVNSLQEDVKLDTKELAKVINIKESHVRRIKYKVIQKLKKELKENQ